MFANRGPVLLPILLLFSLGAAAQTTTGTVNGRVTDTAAAFIPDTSVTLTNVRTGISQTTQTTEEGLFVFPLVQPGSYRMEVSKSGFKKFISQFELAVNQTVRIDAALEVGEVSSTVTVNEKAVLIESETSSLGQVISSRQVEELPLNGRNPFALASLSAGVVPLGSFGVGLNATRMAAQMAGANNFMANGGIAGSNEVLLDGVPITVCCQGQPAIIPSVEVTQEFKIQTNASTAEFGRTSGGILNLVSKSGSNAFHGGVYEFLRNDQLSAANWFTNRAGKVPIPGRDDYRTPLRYNQYGFTVGGPVEIPKLYSGKDKTFFFGGYEGTNVRQYGYVNSTVPTNLMRAGNFSEGTANIYDPATTQADPNNAGQFIRSPFPNNVIPADRQNAITKNYNAYFPLQNAPGVVNNFNWVQSLATDDAQGAVRVDHNFNPANRLFARWSVTDDSYKNGDWENGISGWSQAIHANTFVLSYMKVLSPSLVMDLRYGLAIQRNLFLPDSVGEDVTKLGFPSSFAAQQTVHAIPLLNVSGLRSIGFDSLRNWSRYTHALSANMSWIHGAHTVKFGWDGRLLRDNELTLDGGAGNFSYGAGFANGPNPRAAVPAGQSTFGAYATFLLGLPSSGTIGYSDTWARQQFYHGFYIQDDWHVTRKLTLNLGLRYELETGFTERYNRQAWFDPGMATPLAQQTGLPLTGGVAFSGVGGQPRNLWQTDKNNFSPRVGLAYQITPKTVLRSGFGIFFLPTSQRGYGSGNPGFQVSTPFVSSIDGVTPVGTISNPFPTGTIPLAGSANGPLTLVGAGVSGLHFNSPMSYTQQWNFGIQQELPWKVLLNVAYAGSESAKLPLNFNPNSLPLQYYGAAGDQTQVAYLTQLVKNPFFGIIQTGSLAAATVQRNALLRAFPQFASVGQNYLPQATSSYNSLQVTVQKSLSHGLSLLSSYTWSKNLGVANNLTTGFLDVGTPGFQNDLNRSIERSVLATDIPHRLVVSANYELPVGRGKAYGTNMSRWLDALAGGWQMNTVMSFNSGFPLNFSNAGAASFAGSRPSYTSSTVNPQTSGDIESRLGGVSGGTGYLNASAFRQPMSFEFGDVARLTDNIRSPAKSNIDVSLMKNFVVKEGIRLQLRAEAYNLPNHPVFNSPSTSVGSAGFGVITSQANSPRNVQVALRVIW